MLKKSLECNYNKGQTNIGFNKPKYIEGIYKITAWIFKMYGIHQFIIIS